MDKITDSGSVDMGSIPIRDAKKPNDLDDISLLFGFFVIIN